MPIAALGNINLFYEFKGQGFPLILITGFSNEHSRWAPIIDSLTTHFQVLVFDNRGSGRSDIPDEPYRIEDMADDLFNLMDTLGIEKAHILGHSMGSSIAQSFALKYSKKVEKLILCATFTKIAPARALFFKTTYRLIQDKIDPKKMLDLIISWAFSDEFISHPEKVQAIRDNSLSNPHLFNEIGYRRQMEAILTFNSIDVLKKISPSTLVITGEEDILTPLEDAEVIANNIPNAQLEVIPKAAHDLISEDTDAFLKILLAFLENNK